MAHGLLVKVYPSGGDLGHVSGSFCKEVVSSHSL